MVNVLYKIIANFIVNTFEMVALLGYFGSCFSVVAKVAGMHGESSGNINIEYRSI